MWCNKVEYSTAAELCCTMHDIKVPFCMPFFSISKITEQRFHAKNEKIE